MKDKIVSVFKKKTFWAYILTSIGSFLAGTGELVAFLTQVFAWFN